MLNNKFTKIKPRFLIMKNWIRSNSIAVSVVLSILLVFSISDSIFSQKNFVEQYESIDRMITCYNMTKVFSMNDETIDYIFNMNEANKEHIEEYKKAHPIESKYGKIESQVHLLPDFITQFVTMPIYSAQVFFQNQPHQFYLDEKNNFLISQASSLVLKTPILINLTPDKNYFEKSKSEIYMWLKKESKAKKENVSVISSNFKYVTYSGKIFILPKTIYKIAVYQSWYDLFGEFYCIDSWGTKSVKNISDIQISEEKLNENIIGRDEPQEKINLKFQPFVLQKLDNSSFALTSNQDGQMYSVRIQLAYHPISNVPILLSEEVKLIRKPIHILPYLINRIRNKFVKSKSW